MKFFPTLNVLVAVCLSCGGHAFAGQEMLSVDTKFRAKIAKEKIRASAEKRKMDALDAMAGHDKSLDESHCGSQSIGNIDTGGHGGPAPREVFVFAPNAINIVGRGGCN